MSKPEWKDAPERAGWLAMDMDCTWYWFEIEPYQYANKLWATYGASWLARQGGADNHYDWTRTLEPRPC